MKAQTAAAVPVKQEHPTPSPNPWREYEAEKQKLPPMPPADYEATTRAIRDRLGI